MPLANFKNNLRVNLLLGKRILVILDKREQVVFKKDFKSERDEDKLMLVGSLFLRLEAITEKAFLNIYKYKYSEKRFFKARYIAVLLIYDEHLLNLFISRLIQIYVI